MDDIQTMWGCKRTLLPAIKVILFAAPVMKVKCIFRSKVLLLLLVLLVKAGLGVNDEVKLQNGVKPSTTATFGSVFHSGHYGVYWGTSHNTLYITCLFG